MGRKLTAIITSSMIGLGACSLPYKHEYAEYSKGIKTESTKKAAILVSEPKYAYEWLRVPFEWAYEYTIAEYLKKEMDVDSYVCTFEAKEEDLEKVLKDDDIAVLVVAGHGSKQYWVASDKKVGTDWIEKFLAENPKYKPKEWILKHTCGYGGVGKKTITKYDNPSLVKKITKDLKKIDVELHGNILKPKTLWYTTKHDKLLEELEKMGYCFRRLSQYPNARKMPPLGNHTTKHMIYLPDVNIQNVEGSQKLRKYGTQRDEKLSGLPKSITDQMKKIYLYEGSEEEFSKFVRKLNKKEQKYTGLTYTRYGDTWADVCEIINGLNLVDYHSREKSIIQKITDKYEEAKITFKDVINLQWDRPLRAKDTIEIDMKEYEKKASKAFIEAKQKLIDAPKTTYHNQGWGSKLVENPEHARCGKGIQTPFHFMNKPKPPKMQKKEYKRQKRFPRVS